MKEEPILKVTNRSKSFGGVKAVDNVGFELRPGETLGIIGPNGSGKSTLINLITGFVKPDAGHVSFRGKDITGIAPHKAVTMGIARSFQMARPFYSMPVYKNLVIPLYGPRARALKGGKYGDRDEVAIHLLEEVGFERDSSVPYKLAGALPHGYVKRLELARCLALEPDLIILDESGAPKIRAMEIIAELEGLRRGPYAGAVGYFGFGGDMDTCITIRTIVKVGDAVYLQAGAGIVADSEPVREYQETMNKLKALEQAIRIAEGQEA